jgi:hypothetical protein
MIVTAWRAGAATQTLVDLSGNAPVNSTSITKSGWHPDVEIQRRGAGWDPDRTTEHDGPIPPEILDEITTYRLASGALDRLFGKYAKAMQS